MPAIEPLDIFFRLSRPKAPNVRTPKPDDKLRRRADAGTLTLRHPGGLVSETFREKARNRNRKIKR